MVVINKRFYGLAGGPHAPWIRRNFEPVQRKRVFGVMSQTNQGFFFCTES